MPKSIPKPKPRFKDVKKKPKPNSKYHNRPTLHVPLTTFYTTKPPGKAISSPPDIKPYGEANFSSYTVGCKSIQPPDILRLNSIVNK